MKHPILSPEEIEWAYEKWCLGYPQEDIAKALYVHPNTIGKALKGRKKQRPPLKYPGFCSDKLFVTNVRPKLPKDMRSDNDEELLRLYSRR